MKNVYRISSLITFLCITSLSFGGVAYASSTPPLGIVTSFGIISSTFTNSNTAPQTIINGDICYTTAPVTPPLTITGATTTPCNPLMGVTQGNSIANFNGQACTSLGAGAVSLDTVIIGANPAGTFPPGCYSSGGAMNVTLSSTVTLFTQSFTGDCDAAGVVSLSSGEEKTCTMINTFIPPIFVNRGHPILPPLPPIQGGSPTITTPVTQIIPAVVTPVVQPQTPAFPNTGISPEQGSQNWILILCGGICVITLMAIGTHKKKILFASHKK